MRTAILQWLTGPRAIVGFLVLAAVLGTAGLLAVLHDPPPPMTWRYNATDTMYWGRWEQGPENPDEPHTLIRQVHPDSGLPVLSIHDTIWPDAGTLCGPQEPFEFTFTHTVQIRTSGDGGRFDLKSGTQDGGTLQVVDEDGIATCVFFEASTSVADLLQGFKAFVEERGQVEAQVVYGNVGPADGSILPITGTFEPTIFVDEPIETVQGRLEFLPAPTGEIVPTLAISAETSVDLVNVLGYIAIGMALTAGLWVPFAAIIPLRSALALARRGEHLLGMVNVATNHQMARPVAQIKASYPLTRSDNAGKAERAHQRMIDAVRVLDQEMDAAKAMTELSNHRVLPGDQLETLTLDDLAIDPIGELADLDVSVDLGDTPIVGNARLLRLAIRLLLANAVHHGEATRVDIGRRGRVTTISDNGTGMTQEQADAAWADGTRVNGSDVGHGLLLLQRIITAHEAEASIRSRPGAGVTIEVVGI